MRYLSNEWKAEQWRAFEEEQIGDDTSDCGGGGWDPPCGGCARCMSMQFGYYLNIEEQAARTLLRAGFDVAPPTLINLDIDWYHGGLRYHDASHCQSAGEREAWPFPWEKK